MNVRIADLGTSQQQIRRVKLARIVDRKGELSYGSLIRLATKFLSENEVYDLELDTLSLGGDLSTAGSIASCVALEYQDEDGDTITITSTEELLDAIDQFTDKQVLRLTVRVVVSPQRAGSSFISHLTGLGTVSGATPGSNASVPAEARSIDGSGASASRHSVGDEVPHAPVPVESKKPEATTKLATVLPGTVAPPQDRASPEQSVKNVEKQISGMVDTVVTAFAKAVINLEESLDEIPKKVNNVKRDKVSQATKERSVESNDGGLEQNGVEKVVESSKEKEREGAASGNRQFIHGRHTCDSCLVSPIVGTRYRATNRADYDLCQRCFTNYQGEEIKFKQTQDGTYFHCSRELFCLYFF